MASDYITRTVTNSTYWVDVRFRFYESTPHDNWKTAALALNTYNYPWVTSANVARVTMTRPDRMSCSLEGLHETKRIIRTVDGVYTTETTVDYTTLQHYKKNGYDHVMCHAEFYNDSGIGSGDITFRVYKYSGLERSETSESSEEEITKDCKIIEGDYKYYRYEKGIKVKYKIRHHRRKTTTTTVTERYYYRDRPGGTKIYLTDPETTQTTNIEDSYPEIEYTKDKTDENATMAVECGLTLHFKTCKLTCHPGSANITGTSYTVPAFWGENRTLTDCWCDDGCTVNLSGVMTIPAKAASGTIWCFVWRNSAGEKAGFNIKKS